MQYPKRLDPLAFRPLGETVVVIELNGSRNFHELNESAAHIWNLCDGKHSTDAIAVSLEEAFEISAEEARRDTEEFLSQLQAKQLIAFS